MTDEYLSHVTVSYCYNTFCKWISSSLKVWSILILEEDPLSQFSVSVRPVTPRFHGYGDVTATYIRRSELPSRIYAKHQYRQEWIRVQHKAWYSQICQHKSTNTKSSQFMINITYVFYHNKSKSKIYKIYKRCSRVGWRSRESKRRVWHEELGLGCLPAKGSSIYGGQLHFDPASESEYANPRNQDI